MIELSAGYEKYYQFKYNILYRFNGVHTCVVEAIGAGFKYNILYRFNVGAMSRLWVVQI